MIINLVRYRPVYRNGVPGSSKYMCLKTDLTDCMSYFLKEGSCIEVVEEIFVDISEKDFSELVEENKYDYSQLLDKIYKYSLEIKKKIEYEEKINNLKLKTLKNA